MASEMSVAEPAPAAGGAPPDKNAPVIPDLVVYACSFIIICVVVGGVVALSTVMKERLEIGKQTSAATLSADAGAVRLLAVDEGENEDFRILNDDDPFHYRVSKARDGGKKVPFYEAAHLKEKATDKKVVKAAKAPPAKARTKTKKSTTKAHAKVSTKRRSPAAEKLATRRRVAGPSKTTKSQQQTTKKRAHQLRDPVESENDTSKNNNSLSAIKAGLQNVKTMNVLMGNFTGSEDSQGLNETVVPNLKLDEHVNMSDLSDIVPSEKSEEGNASAEPPHKPLHTFIGISVHRPKASHPRSKGNDTSGSDGLALSSVQGISEEPVSSSASPEERREGRAGDPQSGSSNITSINDSSADVSAPTPLPLGVASGSNESFTVVSFESTSGKASARRERLSDKSPGSIATNASAGGPAAGSESSLKSRNESHLLLESTPGVPGLVGSASESETSLPGRVPGDTNSTKTVSEVPDSPNNPPSLVKHPSSASPESKSSSPKSPESLARGSPVSESNITARGGQVNDSSMPGPPLEKNEKEQSPASGIPEKPVGSIPGGEPRSQPAAPVGASARPLFCHFNHTNAVGLGALNFEPTELPYQYCTHVVYGNIKIFPTTVLLDPETSDRDDLERYAAAKRKFPNVKFMVTIGGEEQDDIALAEAFKDDVKLKLLTNSIVALVQNFTLDGVNLHWDEPDLEGDVERDAIGLLNLVKGLKQLLTTSIIAVTLPNDHEERVAVFNVKELAAAVDYLFLNTHEVYSPYSALTRFPGPAQDVETGGMFTAISEVVKELGNHPPKSLCFTVGLHGVAYQVAATARLDKYVPLANTTRDPSRPPEVQREGHVISYPEICSLQLNCNRAIIEKSCYDKVKDTWFGYADEKAIGSKVKWILQEGWENLCIVAWNIDMDDSTGSCGHTGVRYPLLKSISATSQSLVY
ncbi:uncharacterized protein LOC135388653 isoform X2 [Ornithodoros turicata]|uniref:uncharacterized protein LOC135388653 isoform X2 n=1 Tax=Ornithodoros turicata TaxID=34597 RepID=UPI003139EDE9